MIGQQWELDAIRPIAPHWSNYIVQDKCALMDGIQISVSLSPFGSEAVQEKERKDYQE